MKVKSPDGVTLLWALRSPCRLRCQYCYFGTIEEHKSRHQPLAPGELSHLATDDVPLDVMLSFAATFDRNLVRRVFIAGGEPLQWIGTKALVEGLRPKGIEVVICTNGLPLNDHRLCEWILQPNVDAVSISLDSHDPEYNDRWRIDPSGIGWHGVVNGINQLVEQRKESSAGTKIGVYSVITRHNLSQLSRTARFVSELGLDYFIIQPVSLRKDHRLRGELSLDASHHKELEDALSALAAAGLRIYLPNETYLGLFLRTLTSEPLPVINSCFGGRDLFFIEPDGSIWDCPSTYKIANTPEAHRLSIMNQTATEAFSPSRRSRNTDCELFSQDCVNMWQLMAFDELLHPVNETRSL